MDGPIDETGLDALVVPVVLGDRVGVVVVVGENVGFNRCSGIERVGAEWSSEKSIKRSSSGAGAGAGGCCWARGKDGLVGLAMVVTRVRLVVSSDGGGGREVRTEARQRKHSPLPK